MDISKLSKEKLLQMVQNLTQENIYLKSEQYSCNNENPYFNEYIKQWLVNHKYKWQETTYDGYCNVVLNHIVPYFNNKKIKIRSLKTSDLEAYYAYKIQVDKLSTNTIRRHNANIRKCLRDAMKDDLISKNPAILVDLPAMERSLIDYYTQEDLLILFRYARSNVIYPVVLLASLGLRRSEIIGMHWDNIDFFNKIIKICNKVVPIHKSSYCEQSILKNKSSYRMLQLPEFVINELKYVYDKQVHDFQNNINTYDKTNLNYICLQTNGKKITPVQASEMLLNLVRKFNLKPITLKGLRHTCATIITNAGFNLKYAQEWLGHSTITLTANTYTHISMDSKKEVAKKFDEFFIK